MTATVRAGVFPGDGSYEVREFAAPAPPPGGAVIAVEAVGLCGSDLSQLQGVVDIPGQSYPVVPGHEIVGRIVEITPEGQQAWGLAEGDRVCVDEIVRCGVCSACRGGEPMCPNMQLYGYTMGIDHGHGLWGGYGERMAVLPGTNLHKVPDTIPAEELTMFEPLANAVNWVQRADVQLGDVVVVQGPGHQGLACVMAAHAADKIGRSLAQTNDVAPDDAKVLQDQAVGYFAHRHSVARLQHPVKPLRLPCSGSRGFAELARS